MKEIFDAIERARLAGLRVTVELRVSTTHTITVRGEYKERVGEFKIVAFNAHDYMIDYCYVNANHPNRVSGSVQEMIDNFERGDYNERLDWEF